MKWGKCGKSSCLAIVLASFLWSPCGSVLGETPRTGSDNSSPAADTQPATMPFIQDVALGPGGSLQGQLIDAQGIAAPKFPVAVRNGQQEIATLVTSPQGFFRVTGVRGGVYRVDAGGSTQFIRAWADGTAPPSAQPGVLLVSYQAIVRCQGRVAYPNRRPYVVGEAPISPDLWKTVPPAAQTEILALVESYERRITSLETEVVSLQGQVSALERQLGRNPSQPNLVIPPRPQGGSWLPNGRSGVVRLANNDPVQGYDVRTVSFVNDPPIAKELWDLVPPDAQAAILETLRSYEEDIALLEAEVARLQSLIAGLRSQFGVPQGEAAGRGILPDIRESLIFAGFIGGAVGVYYSVNNPPGS